MAVEANFWPANLGGSAIVSASLRLDKMRERGDAGEKLVRDCNEERIFTGTQLRQI